LNYIDLFHGIGGFALGAHWAGMKFENHFCSDIEPYTQELYKLRFPDSIQLGDITKIDTNELKKYGSDWIITGGFPCQDISIAGKGEGIHGKRSGLWFEYWRLINDLRPRFAIMENVGMLIHRGLREVLGSLAEIGYNAEWQDIRAEDMGAPHKRERIWIVAYTENTRTFGRERVKGNDSIQNISGGHKRSGGRWHNGSKDKIPYPGLQRQTEHEEQTTGIIKCGEEIGNGKIPDTDSQGLQGGQKTGNIKTSRTDGKQQLGRQGKLTGENNWAIEPSMGRLVNGVSFRVERLKGLGNAIVPQIAELLFRQIKDLICQK